MKLSYIITDHKDSQLCQSFDFSFHLTLTKKAISTENLILFSSNKTFSVHRPCFMLFISLFVHFYLLRWLSIICFLVLKILHTFNHFSYEFSLTFFRISSLSYDPDMFNFCHLFQSNSTCDVSNRFKTSFNIRFWSIKHSIYNCTSRIFTFWIRKIN